MGGSGTPGLHLRDEARELRHAPQEAPRRRDLAAPPPREDGRPGRQRRPHARAAAPNWHRNLDRLDALLRLVPSGQRWAVELRDPSWVHDDTFTLLADHGVALCVHDLLPHHPWELTTDWTYVRFHGPDAARAPYHGRYGARALSRAAEAIGRWAAEGVDVHAYFNNDVGGHAVHDARTMARLVGVPLRGDVRPHPVDG